MRRGLYRAAALLCAGAMLTSALPATAYAASGDPTVTGQDGLVLGHESVLTLDLGDPSFNGEKTVTLRDYMAALPKDYVQDGLVLRLDGLEGTDGENGTWENLATGEAIPINREDKQEGEGTNLFQDNGLWLNNSKIYLPASVAEAVNGTAYTVEYFVDKEGYSGYETAYSPLLTVDESGDSWSIFTRDAGETMELKQGSNQTRLKIPFDDSLGAPAAVVYTTEEGIWYLNGQEKASFTPGGQAAAEQVILGGRLGDADKENYQTQAQYYSVRVYDRALSQEELEANAALDRSRFLGEDPAAPDMTFDGVELESDGDTALTLNFTDGAAQLTVVSGELGGQAVTLEVDGQSIQLELQTKSVLDAAADQTPGSLEVTVAASATDNDIRAALAELVEQALEGSPFLEEGGSVQVSGSEAEGFQAVLELDGETARKDLEVTVRREEATAADALAPYFQKVMQGTFSFESAEAVTAEAIEEQVSAMLADDTVTAGAAWDEEASCWQLTLSQGENSAQMPLYINSEVEFTFDDPSLMNYTTTRLAAGDTAYISGGALHLSGTANNTYENVVLPVWHFGDGDVCFEAELHMTSAVNTGRWMALSYGVRPNSAGIADAYTFRQMAVRQDATLNNGVEFAQRTDGSEHSWNVTHTASYSEAIDPDKTYKLTVVYRDGNLYEYINDQLLIRAEDVPAEQLSGKIAFTMDRLTAEMTSLRVTYDLPDLPTELPLTENGYDTVVYEPETGLVMSPTLVSTEETPAAEVAAAGRRPATLVRTLGEDLTVEDDGETVTLAEYLDRLDKKVLPGLRIDDMATAEAFAAYVEENGIVDVNVISADGGVLKAACAGQAGIRGMLDFTGSMPEDTIDVVFATNRSNARVAILPVEAATQDTVAYIQARAVTVWVATDSARLHQAILSGADGLVVEDSEAALDAVESYPADEPVYTRRTVVVAHRGFHQEAPENSERAAMLAVEAGADAIECDVYLSADGEIMINHDDTTKRLMDQNLTVAESTKEQLQALTFTGETAQEGDKMPTLEELFIAADEADPDDDVIHVIEIKHTAEALIEPLAEAIYDAGMEDRVVFISFSDDQLRRIREVMPEISVGELNSCTQSGADTAANLEDLFGQIDPLNAFYNCNYGAQNPGLVEAARHRGVYIHPWTVNDQSVFEQEYGDGYHGITSDRVDFATDYLTGVTVEGDSFTADTGVENALTISAQRETRRGSEKLTDAKVLQLSGVTVNQTENGALWSDQDGEAVIALGSTGTLPLSGDPYTVYSTPVTIAFTEDTVKPEPPIVSDDDDDDDDDGGSSTSNDDASSGNDSSDGTTTQPEEGSSGSKEEETPVTPAVFTDMSDGHWAKEAVDYVTSRGYFNGTSDTTFSPDAQMDRSMLATVLWRMAGQPAASGESAFSDVSAGQWYSQAVSWAAAQGIVTGVEQGLFDPAGNVTREQLAVMLFRYAGGVSVEADLSGFGDSGEISAWALEAMNWAVANGILSGDQNGRLDPGGAATRAEVATMLMRFASLA